MKRIVIGGVIGIILASVTAFFIYWHQDEQKQVQNVLETKSTAITLHRTLPTLRTDIAYEEVKRLQNRILYQESQLSPSDTELQHWLDQSHELLIEMNRELSKRKKEPVKGFNKLKAEFSHFNRLVL